MKYVITKHYEEGDDCNVLSYSADNQIGDGTEGDGYFWTCLEVFCKCYDPHDLTHPVVFASRSEANELAKKIELPRGYLVRELPFVIKDVCEVF